MLQKKGAGGGEAVLPAEGKQRGEMESMTGGSGQIKERREREERLTRVREGEVWSSSQNSNFSNPHDEIILALNFELPCNHLT